MNESPEKTVLSRVLSMYGANLITKYFNHFYEGGFMSGADAADLYKQGILELLPILKDEAAALVDAIAPPDFILNSALGMSDGNVS